MDPLLPLSPLSLLPLPTVEQEELGVSMVPLLVARMAQPGPPLRAEQCLLR